MRILSNIAMFKGYCQWHLEYHKSLQTKNWLIITTCSWFISVVDSDELGPVLPIQVNQSKYEDYENEEAVGAMIAYF